MERFRLKKKNDFPIEFDGPRATLNAKMTISTNMCSMASLTFYVCFHLSITSISQYYFSRCLALLLGSFNIPLAEILLQKVISHSASNDDIFDAMKKPLRFTFFLRSPYICPIFMSRLKRLVITHLRVNID